MARGLFDANNIILALEWPPPFLAFNIQVFIMVAHLGIV